MTWEYKIVFMPDIVHTLSQGIGCWIPDEEALNALGREGWELVGFNWDRGKFIFKRRIPPKSIDEAMQRGLAALVSEVSTPVG